MRWEWCSDQNDAPSISHSHHGRARPDHPAQVLELMARPGGYVYLLANKRNGTLYLGVTSDVPARLEAHREGRGSKFVKKYGVFMLVWHEYHPMYSAAIQRETSLKRWNRAWKLRLIEENNPDWEDLLLKWNA
jgi:putative endonuclease